MKRILTILLFVLFWVDSFSTTYHVSATDGSADFTSITEVNAASFSPGDSILFNRGETFTGTITVTSTGLSGNPIIYGAYGTGANRLFQVLLH